MKVIWTQSSLKMHLISMVMGLNVSLYGQVLFLTRPDTKFKLRGFKWIKYHLIYFEFVFLYDKHINHHWD